MSSSEATTRDIRVEVESQFVPEQSDAQKNLYLFAYRVRIINEGEESVQLLSRHWIITDATGKVEEVKGPGVIGEQPMIDPGEEHEYTSFCPLATASGSMKGTYQMVTDSGESFDATIAPFMLSLHSDMLQ